jgi:predicted ATPase
MIVKKLYIENYRCFGSEPAVIDFSKTGLMAFVGTNNAGKSTALKALDILLGDKWASGQFSEDDFYKKDHGRKIILACEFSETIMVPYSKSSTTPEPVKGLSVEVEYLDSGYGQYSTEVTMRLLREINDFTVGDWEVACYGGKADREVFVSQEIRNKLPIAITIPLIKLHTEQPTNKWGVFSEDEDKKDRFHDKISDAVKVLREPEEFASLESDIKDFWNAIRPNNLSGTALEFLDYDPWHYYRQFRLAITKNGEDVPLDSLGEGVQRLAVIALYRAYLKNHSRSQKALLLIEEPESYLHPQARSVVYQTIKSAV